MHACAVSALSFIIIKMPTLPGYCNLVLQLNLSNYWHQQFQAFVRESANDYFGYGHPLSRTRDMTLAWARLDCEFHTNEVLVEEIQTDLVRDITNMQKTARWAIGKHRDYFYYYGTRVHAHAFSQFGAGFLRAFKNTWHEAMLAATLKFVFDELGVKQMYYHTYETGSALKNIDYRKPPRSIYSDLPQKFCFRETSKAPEFLRANRHARRKLKKLKDSRWFYLAA